MLATCWPSVGHLLQAMHPVGHLMQATHPPRALGDGSPLRPARLRAVRVEAVSRRQEPAKVRVLLAEQNF
jgi:hypothetical protein